MSTALNDQRPGAVYYLIRVVSIMVGITAMIFGGAWAFSIAQGNRSWATDVISVAICVAMVGTYAWVGVLTRRWTYTAGRVPALRRRAWAEAILVGFVLTPVVFSILAVFVSDG